MKRALFFASISISAVVNAAEIATIVADGTNTVHFVCEDENIPAENLAVVSNDFARILAPWINRCRIIEADVPSGNNLGTLDIDIAQMFVSAGDVDIGGFGCVFLTNAVKSVLVSKKMTDYYATNTFFATHSSQIQAAMDFADCLATNSMDVIGVAGIRNICLTKQFAPREMPDSYAQRFCGPNGSFRNITFHCPSILSFGFLDKGPVAGQQYLWVYMPIVIQPDTVSIYPMIYYDNKWWLSWWFMEYGEKAW